MQTVNTYTLAHLGAELVIIGGLTFWFQRKTSLLQDEINQLREKISKHEGFIEHQGQLLARHDQILQSLLSGKPLPIGFNSFRYSKGHPSSQRQNIPPHVAPRTGQDIDISPVNKSPQRLRSRQEKDTDPDLPPEELDKLLQEEIGNIRQSRTSEFIEIKCRGDTCELKAPFQNINRQLKKKNRKRKDGTMRR